MSLSTITAAGDPLTIDDPALLEGLLSPQARSWLAGTRARRTAEFGGWKFMADDDGGDQDGDGDGSGGGDQDGDGDGSGDGDQDGDKPKPEDDPNNIAYWKKRSRQHERENKQLRRQVNAGKQAGKDDDKGGQKAGRKAGEDDEPVDVDKIRAEARAEVEREALQGRIEDKIEAKAKAFADPEDAVAVLLRGNSYDDFLDENNKIDVEAITEALKELGEKKPHLLAQGGRFQGGADGGARKGNSGRPKSLGEAIARKYDKS